MFSAAGASLFLTFLPMLPSQILLSNLLYGGGQLAIPADNVDVLAQAREVSATRRRSRCDRAIISTAPSSVSARRHAHCHDVTHQRLSPDPTPPP
jgi:hypothetical protein